MHAYWLWILLLLSVTGCSVGPVEQLRLGNRQYQLTLMPLTRFNSTGYSCYSFAGAMALKGTALQGELRKQPGQLYLLQGQALLAGALYQVRLVNYMETVELSGQLRGEVGSGLWHTEAGCRGTWHAEVVN